MLGEVSEEPRFSDVAKAAAHYGLCHVSYLGFKSNLFFPGWCDLYFIVPAMP